MIYGYIRVSTREQKEDRQLEALKKYKIKTENIYIDKISGKDFKRPQYQKLIKRVKKGDIIVIKSLDRLGRNYSDLRQQWQKLTHIKRVDIIVIDMPLLNTNQNKDLLGTFTSDLVLEILSFVAETERNNIKQRQAEGIKTAKAKGIKFGRPKIHRLDAYREIFEKLERNELTNKKAMELMKTSESTFYRLKREYRNKS